jgi:hypothetical protein
MKPARHTRILRAAVIAILVTLAGGVVIAPAQAAAYRYWGYFHVTKGSWAFSQTGPAQAIPADGTVDGWRFAVADESSIRTPRATPTFDALCAGTAIKTGSKRVGLVIDYGRPADSADGATPPAAQATCATVPAKATGSDVLVAADATLRLDKAITCAIDGWPATGCGEAVAPVPAAAASPDTTITIAAPKASGMASNPTTKPASNSSTGTRGLILGGAGVVALIAALGFAAWRRGRDATDD